MFSVLSVLSVLESLSVIAARIPKRCVVIDCGSKIIPLNSKRSMVQMFIIMSLMVRKGLFSLSWSAISIAL